MDLVELFDGDVEALLKHCAIGDNMSTLTQRVRDHIKNTPVLYTKHIEERYDRPPKKMKSDPLEYLLLFINHRDYGTQTPLTKMWLFSALDIPRASEALTKTHFSSFVEALFRQVDKSKITHGDTVGIIAAQSCSERFTQSALNSFHSAGVKKSALVGIRRIEEILDAYKKLNLPIMGPLNTKYDVEGLVEKRLKDYCDRSGVLYEPSLRPSDKFSNYLLFFELRDPSEWISISNSRAYRGRADFFFKDGTVYFLLHKNATVELPKLEMSRDVKHTTIPHHVFNSYNLEANRHVSGLKNCIEYDGEDDLIFFRTKTSLAPCTKNPLPGQPDTYRPGIDLSELLRVCPDVDLTKLISNDIYWIYSTLGIAAVEQYLTREIKAVLGAEGININVQHINLITANMTHRGEIRANKYAGMKGNDSVIRKATFQQGTETFAKAAADSAIDHITDVSSQIMMGKLAGVGTALAYTVSNVVEHDPPVAPPSPEYAPMSPDASGSGSPGSPEYCPASPITDMMMEPEIHI